MWLHSICKILDIHTRECSIIFCQVNSAILKPSFTLENNLIETISPASSPSPTNTPLTSTWHLEQLLTQRSTSREAFKLFQLSFTQFLTLSDQQTLYRRWQSTSYNFIICCKTGHLYGLHQCSTDFIKHPLLTLKSIIFLAESAPLFISIKMSLMVPLHIKQHPFDNLAYSSLS